MLWARSSVLTVVTVRDSAVLRRGQSTQKPAGAVCGCGKDAPLLRLCPSLTLATVTSPCVRRNKLAIGLADVSTNIVIASEISVGTIMLSPCRQIKLVGSGHFSVVMIHHRSRQTVSLLFTFIKALEEKHIRGLHEHCDPMCRKRPLCRI